MDATSRVTVDFGVASEPLTVDTVTGACVESTTTSDPAAIDTRAGRLGGSLKIGVVIELTGASSTGAFTGWIWRACAGLTSTNYTSTLSMSEPTVTANLNVMETWSIEGRRRRRVPR